MQKIVLVSFIALITALTTACGSPAAVTQAPVPPAATQAPSSAGNSTEVDVTLADNTISSSLTTFQAGVVYTFVIKNTGRHAHNFNINTPVSIAGDIDAALSTALLAFPQEQLG